MGNILLLSIAILLPIVVLGALITFLLNILVSLIEDIEWR